MDFVKIGFEYGKKESVTIKPEFVLGKNKDIMIRGKSFYAVWDEKEQIWSIDEYDIARLIDNMLYEKADELRKTGVEVIIKTMRDHSSKMWTNYKTFLRESPDNYRLLDSGLTFSNTEVKKTDYVSRRLPYPLEKGEMVAYEELIETLYVDEERRKLEWAIGSIIAGDSKNIQKFIVLYGEPGSGKSTLLHIVQKLFPGYYTMFEAKALVGSNNTFATEVFRNNPLVAIQHDGDLSRIEDNTKLNSIISHEEMQINEKYKPAYNIRFNAFLFMGTNDPVRIKNAKSGMHRRLIDVSPSGKKVPNKRYHLLMNKIDFELGAIAWHCLEVYKEMGKNYYSTYIPLEMMFHTDMFFNFVEESRYIFQEEEYMTLKRAWEMYKEYCVESSLEYKLSMPKFREELKNYYEKFDDITRIDGKQVRSVFSGFKVDKFSKGHDKNNEERIEKLVFQECLSVFDEIYKTAPGQYAKQEDDTPEQRWDRVNTTLGDLHTRRLHYVRLPLNHIVIDFDLKNEKGEKDLAKNIEEASKYPNTYAEISRSGNGVHLHYIYTGDVTRLSNDAGPGIEIKKFTGNSALRRKLTKCTDSPIATISSGLPLKGAKSVLNFDTVKSEQGLRKLIDRNLKKEIHSGTKSSVDFIFKILNDAYKSGMKYDVTDMRGKILSFANNSTNQSDYCVKLVGKMKFHSEEPSESSEEYASDELIFFDTEVFPNLFVVCWKAEGKEPVKMINPSPNEVSELFKFKLVGFNNRRYDNHILYARHLGYSNEQIFELSQKLVGDSKNAFFREAYKLSYTDIYDFAMTKKSLKKWQIDLGIHHQEIGLKWEESVPEELWDKVADYCVNDVISEEIVFNHLKDDFTARLILSDLSGLTPNDLTSTHSAKILFGEDKKPQDKFVYTDLSKMFPGYKFDRGISTYQGEKIGEGGYVYSEPGMYTNVAVLDVVSMHPASIIAMDMFGPYTKAFKELKDARVAIKRRDYESVKGMLNGILENYLTDDSNTSALAYAMKIVINQIYGLTAARFDNKFKDPRNKDNIVAKRGALFMVDLKYAVQEQGYIVSHIKTDSIKIPNATPEVLEFIFDFGKKYGYEFEHETTYSKFCLINDAVFAGQSLNGKWDSVGAQVIHPYVFKTLFSKEEIIFEDLIEAKSVTTALYLNMNEDKEEDDLRFIGRVGAFVPIKPGCGGGLLLRQKGDKYDAATGTKGYRWLEAEMVKELGKEDDIDLEYYSGLVMDAKNNISKYGDVDWFLGEKEIYEPELAPIGMDDIPPFRTPCGSKKYENCVVCPQVDENEPLGKCKLGYESDIPF